MLREILDRLSDEGIEIVPVEKLGADDRHLAEQSYHDLIYPVLTPLAVDPGHPFPVHLQPLAEPCRHDP